MRKLSKSDFFKTAHQIDHDQMTEVARSNIERHLGDCDCESADEIYDNAYTLAFDALVDAGVASDVARGIAQEVSKCYAQT